MEEREVKVAQNSNFSVAWRCKPKYGIDTDNLYTRRSNKKHYARVSISFNQHDRIALFCSFGKPINTRGKKSHEKKKDKRAGNKRRQEKEREAEGSSNTTRSPFSFSFFSSTLSCIGTHERDRRRWQQWMPRRPAKPRRHAQ